MAPRTFVVAVSESPARIVVEDVRNRRRVLASRLADVGTEIAQLLDAPALDADRDERTGQEVR